MSEVFEVLIPKEALCKERIVYIIKFDKPVQYYVGITETASKTGTSVPIKRLYKHMFPAGKTFSIVRSKKIDLNSNNIFYRFMFINGDKAKDAEKWLIWKLRAGKVNVLNRPTDIEPHIDNHLKDKLIELWEKSK